MDKSQPETLSLLSSERKPPTHCSQQFTIPRRPLPPQSTIGSPDLLNTGKPQTEIAVINVADGYSPKNDERTQIVHGFWSPIWLRRSTLLALIALFVAIEASLIILWRLDQVQNGFRPLWSSRYYAWTYGPTAILVIVLCFWRQVDYHCKILQPWQEMRRGPTDAAQSLLLDYVSPLNITSFIRAVRYRHLPVTASIAGFATLKLIILFSTGLIVLTPTSTSDMVPVTITTKFDGLNFWKTMPIDRPHITLVYDDPWTSHISAGAAYLNVSASPVHTYLGLLSGNYTESKGVVGDQAFQSFEVANSLGLDSISFHVNAFVPKVTCEVANVTRRYPIEEEATLTLQLDTPTCSVGHEDQTLIPFYGFPCDDCDENDCHLPQTLCSLSRVNCSEINNSSFDTPLGVDTPYDFRYALVVANVSYTAIGQPDNLTDYNTTVHELSVVICKFDYSMDEAVLTYQYANNSYHLERLQQGQQLKSLTGLMLGEIVYASFWAATDLFFTNYYKFQNYPQTSFFNAMVGTTSGKRSTDCLLSTKTLKQSAIQVFEGVAAHFMHQFYQIPDSVNTTASGVYVEDRLRVAAVSVWSMATGFILMILFSLAILFTTLDSVVPQDPEFVATSAIVLRNSFGLQKLLYGTGSFRTSHLVNKLRGQTFHTKSSDFMIHVANENTSIANVQKIKPKTGYWVPTAARHAMIALTFGAPLAAAIVLEVLYRMSEAHQGLFDVSASEKIASYLSRYIPASIMLLIATCFNSLDFAIASFAPFSLLLSGSVSAGRKFSCLLGMVPPQALFHSLRTMHLSSALSNLAGTIGSVLTIIASGLWTFDRAIQSQTPTTAVVASTWNVTWPNSSREDSGAAATLDRIQHGMAKFPARVWNDVVLVDITDVRLVGERSSITESHSQNYTFNVPAIRPVLMCDVVEDQFVKIHIREPDDYYHGPLWINALPPLPPGCHMSGANRSNDYTNFTSDMAEIDDANLQPVWIGNLFDIHLGPLIDCERYDDGFCYASEFDESDAVEIPDNPAGCPSIGIVFAELKGNATSNEDVTVLLCSQKLQLVSAKVTYDSISGIPHPDTNQVTVPITDGNPARYLTNGTDGVDKFPYRVEANINNALTKFNTDDHSKSMDTFFNNLVYGPNGTSLRDIAGRANRKKLLEAVQTMYARYMVLVLDMHLREPIAFPSVKGQQLTGTLDLRTTRLQVNFPSKLALQIMLGLMTLLGMGAFCLSDLRGSLPRNPCSIASKMGFLAGSDLCDPDKHILPEGAQWLTRKEIEKTLDGWLFSLGWWANQRAEEEEEQHVETAREGCDGGEENVVSRKQVKAERFGIDVGRPERLGFRETKWWTFRRRLRREKKDVKKKE